MKYFHKFILLGLSICFLSQYLFVFPVYASTTDSGDDTDNASDTTSNTSSVNISSLGSDALSIMDGMKPSEKYSKYLAESIALIVLTGRSEGWTDEAIAGVLANFEHESGINPYMLEGYGERSFSAWECFDNGDTSYKYGNAATTNSNVFGGIGLAQWTYGRHQTLLDFSDSNADQKYLIKGAWQVSEGGGYKYESEVGDSGVQVAFCFYEMAGNGFSWHGDSCTKVGVSCATEDDYKQLTDVKDATAAWCAGYERPGGWEEEAVSRQSNADDWLNIVKGDYGWGSYVSDTANDNLKGSLVSAGYWSEDDLAIYNKLVEESIDLSGATRDKLKQDQLEGLAMWERENQHSIEEGGLISWLRRIVMLVGILFTIWMALIYCAYWFDRINNFFYIDALGFLTAGHLHMSENEQESTFRVKDLGKDTHKTVRHRDILFICLVGVAFGVCIITGFIYDVLNSLIRTIFRILGSL